jgi:hypothetical protein
LSRAFDQLEAARSARDSARAVFDERLAHVRADIETRGVGGRIADKLGEDARQALGEALDVASESKGVIAGTTAALALWLLRNPITAWVEGLISTNEDMKHD